MSASPVARQAVSKSQEKDTKESVPQTIPRKVIINSPADLPNDYGTTPGGTLFSTTPGGTRIIYERAFLLSLKSSPLAQSPPKTLPNIPGVTKADVTSVTRQVNRIAEEPEKTGEDEQFAMEL